VVLSFDTNISFPAVQPPHPRHGVAAAFLASLETRQDVVISELSLLELYVLLRNPAAVRRPLSGAEAVAVCDAFRNHPRWQVVGLPAKSREFHDTFWPQLTVAGFARRRAYDWRMALSLLQQGVTEFATANVRDFEGFGFTRVWNPLAAP
jgi:uncharacterized protein